jgi:hypothetical protein
VGVLKKILIGSSIGAVIIGAVTYVGRLKRTSVQLESVASSMVHSIKLDGLVIRVDVQLKNPTSTSLKIAFPFVKLFFKGKLIGTSKVVNQTISIPANGEAKVSGMMISISPTGLMSAASGLFSLLTKRQSAELEVKTITTIDLGWKKIPYEKSDKSQLKSKAK